VVRRGDGVAVHVFGDVADAVAHGVGPLTPTFSPRSGEREEEAGSLPARRPEGPRSRGQARLAEAALSA
jgi:hypothetical protein